MLILICYDVSIIHKNGVKRLRRVAKICQDYGQRVQNSVFECKVTPAEYVELKHLLLDEIDLNQDSLRFYKLGSNWQKNLEILGKSESYDPEKTVLYFEFL